MNQQTSVGLLLEITDAAAENVGRHAVFCRKIGNNRFIGRLTDELLRSFLFWICKNIQYIALLNQLPLRQNGHAVTDALDDVQFMRNQKDRDMQFLIDFEQQF